jgi:hypothetical protein
MGQSHGRPLERVAASAQIGKNAHFCAISRFGTPAAMAEDKATQADIDGADPVAPHKPKERRHPS